MDTVASNLLKKLKEKVAQLEVEDPVQLALDSELAGEDELTWLLQIMTLPHWFDIPMLNSVLPDVLKPDLEMDPIGLPPDYVEALLNLSFVVELPQAAGLKESHSRFQINQVYRTRLLKHWQDPERREGLVVFSERFRNYFCRLHKEADDFEGPILEREILYHNFVANERKARALFRTLYEKAESANQLGVCQALVNLATEQKSFFQEKSTTAWLIYYQGRLNLMLGKLPNARKQFEEILAQSHVRRWLRGKAQAGLGDVSRAEGRWSQAMREYEQSLGVWLNIPINRLPIMHERDIREQITVSKMQLEVARICTSMADLVLAMGTPTIPLSKIRSRMLPAEVQQRLQTRAHESQLILTNIVYQRLQAFAEKLYRQALEILLPTTGETSEVPVEPLRNRLIWHIRHGLATVLLLEGKQDAAYAYISKHETLASTRFEQAEVILALGDCSLASNQIDDAATKYQTAVDYLKDTWDRPAKAKALHRLGRAKALQEQWHKAFFFLTDSRRIYSQLDNKREEEKVQETLRELAREEDVPDEMRQDIKEDMAGWSAHHFAYSASSPVLNRVKRLWWPMFFIATVALGILWFLIIRSVGIWFLSLFGAGQILSLWWANVLLIPFCCIYALIALEDLAYFRRLVGRLLPLDSIWGSQPDFVTVDDGHFTHVNSTGKIRMMAWDEVTELRRGYSDHWVVGEASIMSGGAPGGSLLLFSSRGVLRANASINSFLDLDKLVAERVEESVQNYKKFRYTFRGMAETFVLLSGALGLFGFPIILVLTSSDTSWWMMVLKVLAFSFALLVGLGLGSGLVMEMTDAIRMRRFLYPRHLHDRQLPVPQAKPGSHYINQKRKSL